MSKRSEVERYDPDLWNTNLNLLFNQPGQGEIQRDTPLDGLSRTNRRIPGKKLSRAGSL